MTRTAAAALTVLLAAFAAAPAAAAGAATSSRASKIPSWAEPKRPEHSRYLPDRLIVKFSGDRPHAAAAADRVTGLAARYDARRFEPLFPATAGGRGAGAPGLPGLYVLWYDAPVDPFTAAAEVSSLPGVEYAEPWFIYELESAAAYTPSDSSFNLQWYLKTVRADSAWDVQKGDTNVVVGFVDTGVQTTHPDLSANVWVNPGEDGPDGVGGDRRTNNVDDDGNGKIDDWQGWDFGGADFAAPSQDNAPVPTAANNAHGTHVAGLACAATDNNRGIAGAGFRTRLLPVKATSDNDTRGPGGTPFIIAGYQGIVYAAEMGADVISLSWGGAGYSQAEQDVINYAASLGALVVAAAGNTGSAAELQYPASYDNVVSVAATQFNADLKTTYSSYNERVDVSAPGGQGSASTQIYSTYYPNTYAYAIGTSMSTPIVAGVAALVRAHFPGYTPQQAAEQLRVTCDDIYAQNSTYRYKLGKGRLNAWRALNEASPAIRMVSLQAKDSAGGNNNGAFEVNEDVDMVMEFTNYLLPTSSSTTITLASTDPSVTVTSGGFIAGAIPTGGTVNNASAPFRVRVQPGIGPLRVVTFTLEFTDVAYFDRQQFTLLFNPTYATHTVNNVEATLTNNGRIGFQNFPSNTLGVGFIYGGNNQLFEGGLIMGTSASKVPNNVRNAGGTQDNDFSSAVTYAMQRPGPVADEQGSTYFADSAASAAVRLNVRVAMTSYASAAAPDDDFVIASYDVRNVSGSPLTNFYIGVFLDWDVHHASSAVNAGSYWDSNKAAFDQPRDLAYVRYDTAGPTPHVGTVALEGTAAYTTLFNRAGIDLSDAAKWGWISGPIAGDTSKGDVHTVISSGPYTIPDGGSRRVGFAFVGGDDLADLLANADAAIARWGVIKTLTSADDPEPGLPAAFRLEQNYPNPFNPSTAIRYALPAAGRVRLTVFSPLGGEVRRLLDGETRGPGLHETAWDGRDANGRPVASGVYFYRMEFSPAGGDPAASETRKFVLLR